MLALPGRWLFVGQLFGGMAVGVAVFAVAARLMKMSELGDLLRRSPAETAPAETARPE
jgi:hypothetical protein